MYDGYYNFYTRLAESWWERRDFLRGWRKLHAGDRRWVPPYHPAMAAALTPGRTSHIDRQKPALFWIEALQGRPNTDGKFGAHRYTNVFMEEAVALTALMADPRRRDQTATLNLLSVANDIESLERLLTVAHEQAYARGRSRLLGPVHLSPHLGYGALLDHFHQSPPLYTPYNPPYMPEILDGVLERVLTARLYHHIITGPAAQETGIATLRPMRADDDASILPNLLTALDDNPHFPRPDAIEATFLLEWWRIAPRLGWIAEVEGEAVGFVLLQPDLGPALRRAKGARPWHWRAWWQWRRLQPAKNGRLVAGGVLPRWRRQGIGHQLWRAMQQSAYEQKWHSVSIGPVVDDSAASAFLLVHYAQPIQHYTLYATD